MHLVILGHGRVVASAIPVFGNKIVCLSEPIASPRQREVIPAGAVLMLRGSEGYAAYGDLEAAIGGLRHAAKSYGSSDSGETAAMAALRSSLEELADRFFGAGRQGADDQEVESLIAGLGSRLAGSSNAFKAKARAQALGAAQPCDCLGRRNPGRRRLLLAQASGNIGRREREIAEIRSKLEERGRALVELYESHIRSVRFAKGLLDSLIEDSGWKLPDEGESGAYARRLFGAKAFVVFQEAAARLSSLRANPFLKVREQALGCLHAASAGVCREGFPAHRQAIMARDFCRIALAHVALARIIADLRWNGPPDAARTAQLAARLDAFCRRLATVIPVARDGSGRTLKLVGSRVSQAAAELEAGRHAEAAASLAAELPNL